MGPWDYNKNKDKINEVLSNRVKENCAYENVYTLALRGLHDAAMGGGDVPMREKVKMLESALNAQRGSLPGISTNLLKQSHRHLRLKGSAGNLFERTGIAG